VFEKVRSRWLPWLLAVLLVFGMLTGAVACEETVSDVLDLAIDLLEEESGAPTVPDPGVGFGESSGDVDDVPDEDGHYTSREDVALYLWTYKRLPGNFLTKNEARDLGWEGGSLERFAPGCAIGGDRFGNYEGLLPEGDYRECDIDTVGADSRGAKRLVYTADCSRIYYTDDHYESFTLLFGEEG